MMNNKCEYANDGVRITAPGKFEGCPLFAPHYWDLGLQGFADTDNGTVYTFKFSKAGWAAHDQAWAIELKAWLGRSRVLRISEDSQGFVHCY